MLRVSDVGRTVESRTYMDSRKTSKPRSRQRDVYTIESIYVHKNGTILINQSNGYKIYLRPDTEIFFHYEE